MKQFIRRSLRRLGVDIVRVRNQPDLVAFLQDRHIDVVVDVGANVGQFGKLLRAKGYRGKIVSFEPVESVFKSLETTARADGNWVAHHFALGARSETSTINIAAASTYSSILPMNDAAVLHDPAAAAMREEKIEIKRLDDVLPNPSGNILLKIDTQGYERRVLEGAVKGLSMMKGVIMELPIIHLYKGTWAVHEAIEYMADAGFVPAQIHPVNYHLMDPLSLIEVDCLFRRCDKRLDSSS